MPTFFCFKKRQKTKQDKKGNTFAHFNLHLSDRSDYIRLLLLKNKINTACSSVA